MKNKNLTPKTPKGFDYGLFRDENRVPYARILSSGEVTAVSEELFKYLRAEERRYSRYIEKNTIEEKDEKGNVISSESVLLSIDFVADSADDGGVWLIDKNNTEEAIRVKLLIEDFEKLLSERQFEVFKNCMIDGLSFKEYADIIGVDKTSVRDAVNAIRKKAKNFF